MVVLSRLLCVPGQAGHVNAQELALPLGIGPEPEPERGLVLEEPASSP
jgi:hypothetical protein